MKNKSLKILALVLTGTLLTGCSLFNKKDNGSSSNKSDDNPVEQGVWSDDVQAEMLQYIGEVLPYAPLEEESLGTYYDRSTASSYGYASYYVYDGSADDAFDGYGDRLIAAGYELVEDDYGDYYAKTLANGFELSLIFGWEEETEDTYQGNTITAQFEVFVDTSTGESGWPVFAEEDMLYYLGEILPYAQYNASTLYSEYDPSYETLGMGAYYLGDDNENDVLTSDYASKLIQQGYTYDSEYQSYDKTLSDGTVLSASFDYYEADEDYEAGNEICVYIYYGGLDDDGGDEGGDDNGGGQTDNDDVASETTNTDGTISVSFSFEGVLNDQEDVDGRTFSSTHASLTISKGTNANGVTPKYYSNGDTLRCYTGNSLEFNAATSYKISEVHITIGSHKTLDGVASEFSVNHGTVAVTDSVATISGVNNSNLAVSIAPDQTKGNLGLTNIVITIVQA